VAFCGSHSILTNRFVPLRLDSLRCFLGVMEIGDEIKHVLALNQSLFLDEHKDVTFKLADGEEHAHAVILKGCSEVFCGMFHQNMREKFEGVVELPGVPRAAMRVFLRLLYTGHVDESDWPQQPEDSMQPTVKLLRSRHTICQSPQLTSQSSDNWGSAMLLDCDSTSFEFSIRADWPKLTVMIGIAPKDVQLTASLYSGRGCYFYVCAGSLQSKYGQDRGAETLSLIQLHPHAIVTMRYTPTNSSVSISVDNSDFITVSTALPKNVQYCPAINMPGSGQTLEVVSGPSTCPQCPVHILLAVASLAKKYMVQSVLSMTIQALKKRLGQAKSQRCTDTFEQILAGAIAHDMGAARMAALECAKDFPSVREKYDGKQLRPEVAFELEAIWPSPRGVPVKCARLA